MSREDFTNARLHGVVYYINAVARVYDSYNVLYYIYIYMAEKRIFVYYVYSMVLLKDVC